MWVFDSLSNSKFYLNIALQNDTVIGKIIEMLTHGSTAIAVVDVYQVASARDTIFNMPMLACRHGEVSQLILPAKVSGLYLDAYSSC
jgi:hypothetical protein